MVLKFRLRHCAPVTHQDQGETYRAPGLLRMPLAALPAPENRMFLATSMNIDRSTRPHNFMASLRAFQPLMARGAGATSLQTGGMGVARNQQHGFANPKAALPLPSSKRQLPLM
jgi:hypothetical protein